MTDVKPPSLEEVRAKIDLIDRELLSLIDRRAAMAHEVTRAKEAAGQGSNFALRPARETALIRKLLTLPRESADRALIIRIWRELVGDSLARQGPFHLTVWGGKNPARASELARLRFGWAPSLRMVDKPEEAVASARMFGQVGVLPLEGVWWARLLAEPKVSVFAVVPCLGVWGQPQALAIADVPIEPSGEGDETLWLTDSSEQSWQIEIALGRDGVAAKLLYEGGGLKLFSLAGFYEKNDERLARGPGRLTGVIGVVPAPFDY